MRLAILSLCLILFSAGCSLLQEKPPDPRGVQIPETKVPDAVLRKFKQSGQQIHRIEQTRGGTFRFETASGSIIHYNEDGSVRGMNI